ncbi:MAG: lysophospholipid acyltransferase family protein [Armatimonadetes bacterium]|nr:lysophospholipid acyltransferase family protein [Akkermansiaceae bacterium]
MACSKITEIRGNRRSRMLGFLAGITMKLWSFTLRYRITDLSGIAKPVPIATPVIFALWHNRIFTMPPIWRKTGGKNRSTVVLTSASKDGSTLATAMAMFGLGAIRGSSSRRAVAALIGMKKAILAGHDVCVTPDGPKGPRYIVQPGLIKISQATSAAIIPIHIQYSSAWQLKTWDQFVIPKPFSTVKVTFDQPQIISKNLSPEDFETERVNLQNRLLNGL